MHASIQTASPPRGGNDLALSVVGALFFMLGFITCLNDILIPHLKAIFNLNYTQAMLVQFCFFTAYAVMSVPMSKLVEKMGYKAGIIGGFLIAALGCVLFYPAAASASYPIFLGALFYFGFGDCAAASGGQSVCNAACAQRQRIGDAHADSSV